MNRCQRCREFLVRLPLLCRLLGHDAADFWVPVSHTCAARPLVEVRRCYRCGAIVEQRDVDPTARDEAPPRPWPPIPDEVWP